MVDGPLSVPREENRWASLGPYVLEHHQKRSQSLRDDLSLTPQRNEMARESDRELIDHLLGRSVWATGRMRRNTLRVSKVSSLIRGYRHINNVYRGNTK